MSESNKDAEIEGLGDQKEENDLSININDPKLKSKLSINIFAIQYNEIVEESGYPDPETMMIITLSTSENQSYQNRSLFSSQNLDFVLNYIKTREEYMHIQIVEIIIKDLIDIDQVLDSVSNIPSLKELFLESEILPTKFEFETIPLDTLTINQINYDWKSKSLNQDFGDGDRIRNMLFRFPNIINLNLSLNGIEYFSPNLLNISLPRIETFFLSLQNSSEEIVQIASKMINLKDLKIELTEDIQFPFLDVRSQKSLKSMSMQCLHPLIRFCSCKIPPNLQSLTLTGCQQYQRRYQIVPIFNFCLLNHEIKDESKENDNSEEENDNFEEEESQHQIDQDDGQVEQQNTKFISLFHLKFLTITLSTESDEIFTHQMSFISQLLMQLSECNVSLSRVSSQIITSLCSFLNSQSSSIIKLNINNFSYSSLEQKLDLGFAIRNMKHPELFYFNNFHIFSQKWINYYSGMEYHNYDHIIMLACSEISKQITSKFYFLDDPPQKISMQINKIYQENQNSVYLTKFQELLSPFKRIGLSKNICPVTQNQPQPQFIWNSENSKQNASSVWDDEEKQQKFLSLSNTWTKFANPSLQILNLLSKNLIHLGFETHSFNLLEIEQFANKFPSLIRLSGISLDLNDEQIETSSFLPQRSLLLNIQMKQNDKLENIFKVREHLINIWENRHLPPITFEEVKKILELMYNSDNRILYSPCNYSHKVKELSEIIIYYTSTVIQQMLITKSFYQLIADQLTINPRMIFSDIWL